ncbi:MAG: ATP-binding protein [Desulfobacteraceae bacterium]
MDIFSFFSNFRLKSRLSYRILSYILICSTLFTFISTAIQLYAEYQRDMDSVAEGLNEIRESYLNFLSLSLWDMDENQLNVQLQGALLLPDIQYLEVREIRASMEEVFSSAGNPKDEGGAHYQFPLFYKTGQEKMHIGNLYVTVDLKGVYQRLYDRVALVLTTQAVKTFLWAFCVLTIFQHVIMRNLNTIAEYLKQLDVTRLNVPLTLNRKISASHRPDELEHVVKAINSMSKNLMQSMAERRQAEEELRRLNTELDQRVLDRTAQLETANKELEGFTYSVSHDLRAPLRHIDGFLELLQNKAGNALDEQARHYMHTISDAARKMGRLIDDLLSFSRMGRHALSVRKVALGELVRDILSEFEPDTAGRNIDWRIGDFPLVSGDGAMLRIVLVNLISNALKFTRPRQEARIEIGSLPGQTKEVVIYVRDNGVGFDMTYVDKLFGVFQRLHRAEEFEGTGIGLANVRRIIARHGGRTWAEGELNQGAVFYFSLPRSIQGSSP